MFRALCAHRQEVKIVLYSIWYYTLKQVSDLKLLKYNYINMIFLFSFFRAKVYVCKYSQVLALLLCFF